MADDKKIEDMTQEELVAGLTGARAQNKEDTAKIAALNVESAGRRVRLNEIDAEQAKKDKAKLTEMEQLQAEVKSARDEHTTLQGQLKAERVRMALLRKAGELEFANPEDAIALIDLSQVEVADDGRVSGFEKSLKALAESGRLVMKDQKRSDGIGTPPSTGKPGSSGGKTLHPINIRT